MFVLGFNKSRCDTKQSDSGEDFETTVAVIGQWWSTTVSSLGTTAVY